MTNQHPITPPPELMQQWYDDARDASVSTPQIEKLIATLAAQWGADQELEASVSWLVKNQNPRWADALYAARRPKPPSLKEQALELAGPAGTDGAHVTFGPEELALIRRALEQLDD